MNICVTIGSCSRNELYQKLYANELAEIRLDLLDWVTIADVKNIFSSHGNLVATFRPGKCDETERLNMLLASVEAGAAYVDIETENNPDFIAGIVKASEKSGTKVIISYHNYELTPSLKVVREIVVEALAKGADIVKMACKVNSERDCARLLSLLDGKRPVIPVGMGKAGLITRISALFLGAPFTYVGLDHNPETVKKIISEISDV